MKELRISAGIRLFGELQGELLPFVRRGLENHKRLGFDAADFAWHRFLTPMGEDWERMTDEVRAISEEIGIRFEVCHLPFGGGRGPTPEADAAFNEKVHRAIDGAARLGVDYAVVHPNTTTVPKLEFDRRQQYDAVMSHLAPFVEHGNRVGVNIVVENMRPVPMIRPFYRYCAETEEVCTIADALGIGICWDFGHAHIAGLRQSEALRYVGKRLKMLHINDNFAWDDEHIPPFTGSIDWPDAMKGLHEIGFEGLLNYEVDSPKIPLCARESYVRYLIDVAHHLQSLIGE